MKSSVMLFCDKDPPKIPVNLLSVRLYSWVHNLWLRVACFPSETLLEETEFLFASGYQLERAFELGMGECVHFTQF